MACSRSATGQSSLAAFQPRRLTSSEGAGLVVFERKYALKVKGVSCLLQRCNGGLIVNSCL